VPRRTTATNPSVADLAAGKLAASAPEATLLYAPPARWRYTPRREGSGASGQRVRLDVPDATSSMTRARSPRTSTPFGCDVDDEGRPIREVPECRGGSMAEKKGGTVKVVRDAKTGEFVKRSEAKKQPSTTVTESIQRPKKK